MTIEELIKKLIKKRDAERFKELVEREEWNRRLRF